MCSAPSSISAFTAARTSISRQDAPMDAGRPFLAYRAIGEGCDGAPDVAASSQPHEDDPTSRGRRARPMIDRDSTACPLDQQAEQAAEDPAPTSSDATVGGACS